MVSTSEMSEETIEATTEEKKKAKLVSSAAETEETTELTLEEKKKKGFDYF